jgi:hypothetical protein
MIDRNCPQRVIKFGSRCDPSVMCKRGFRQFRLSAFVRKPMFNQPIE